MKATYQYGPDKLHRSIIASQTQTGRMKTWHVADITIGEFLHTLFGYEISENSVLRLDGKEIASTPDTIAATALLAPVVAGDGTHRW